MSKTWNPIFYFLLECCYSCFFIFWMQFGLLFSFTKSDFLENQNGTSCWLNFYQSSFFSMDATFFNTFLIFLKNPWWESWEIKPKSNKQKIREGVDWERQKHLCEFLECIDFSIGFLIFIKDIRITLKKFLKRGIKNPKITRSSRKSIITMC